MALGVPTLVANIGTQTINTLPDGGQATMVNSLPVVIASDQTAFPVGTAIAPVVSPSLESSRVLKGSAGSLYGLSVVITTVSGWIMIFNTTSAPADGAVVPIFVAPVDSNSTVGYWSGTWSNPILCSVGITVAFSTTGPFTKTASATAAFSGQVK